MFCCLATSESVDKLPDKFFTVDISEHVFENNVEIDPRDASVTEVSDQFAEEWKKLGLDNTGEYFSLSKDYDISCTLDYE